ncbi:general stress protein [Flaviflexus huanghaiensis]|uniref:general stress protein n=1 Tax=Flaviflexus huanghaiensis TaxID=1111473 RepID=UPI0019D6834E|nr:general stress protein [Flaviflexus huanghaiensis]
MDSKDHLDRYSTGVDEGGRSWRHASTINYRVLTSVRSYSEAQHIVDTLSDANFPVENVRIVGLGLESVEQVTGRKTTWTAAWQGALYGAWMGLFFGLLFLFFAPVIAWRVLLTAIVLGMLFGAIAEAFSHGLQGGRRDFTSFATTRASRYEIHVVAGLIDDASRIINA